MPLTIISGPPGAGKTSLARLLAAMDPAGVHIEADAFFRALAHRADPSLPGAAAQNQTVMRACAAAAREYSAGGYAVYLDGVVGPWMLPVFTGFVPRFDYVLLQVPLDVALARARSRAGQPSAKPDVIERMHVQFARVLADYRRHVIDASVLGVDEIAAAYRSARASDTYAAGTP